MYANPFDGPRAKIERSKEHFNELVRAEQAYREEQPVHIETRTADDGGTIVIAVADKLPGLREATIVADILGNFRSALDLAVSQACLLAGASNLEKTYFAFASSEKQWDDSLNHRMKAAPAHIRAVVRALKPWKDGNLVLYALSKLVSSDKHRLLVPTAGLTRQMMIDNFKLESEDGKNGGLTEVRPRVPIWKPGQREAQLMWVEPGSKVIVGGPVILSLRFAFGDVEVVPNQPIIPLLNQMGGICENAIDLIERAASA
jgi:hypothetical protein